MPAAHQFVLTLSCRDAKGIVHAVAGLLYQAGCNIVDSQQFGDVTDDGTGLFFMRVHFEAPEHARPTRPTLDALFGDVRDAVRHGLRSCMRWRGARALLLMVASTATA